jgi:hypothetical protein
MPRVFKSDSPIGVFVPLVAIPCLKFPGDTTPDDEQPVCRPGVPYEVIIEHVEIKNSTYPNRRIMWLGLRPSKDIQTNLDWVALDFESETPVGFYTSLVDDAPISIRGEYIS